MESKLLYATCYEVGHCWDPSCIKSNAQIAYSAYLESFKIYAPLYLFAAIIRRKGKRYFMKRLLPEILQSTVFLGTNGTLFLTSFCIWRHLLGRFYFGNLGFLPGIGSCLVAISLERKARRGLLALYMTNVALETAYRMAVARNYFRPIKHGEVILFSLATAVYMYLYKSKNGLSGFMQSAISMVLGSSEAPPRENGEAVDPHSGRGVTKSPILSYMPHTLQTVIARWRQGAKHRLCQHRHSCVASTIEGSLRLFLAGYTIQAALGVLGSLRRPSQIMKALKKTDNFRLGAFLASFVAIFKSVNCLLRWLRDRDSSLHGLVAGFLAGWSMMWYKSSTLALYAVTKLLEIVYFKGIDSGVLPYVKFADTIIYCLATSFVFHCAVLEPQNVKPAYWKFLMTLTHGKFALMNRRLMEVFVPHAQAMYPDYKPKYDPRYTSL